MRRRASAILIVVATLGAVGCSPTRFSRPGKFGMVVVRDVGARRVLYLGSSEGSEQSAIVRGNPRAVPMEYVRYALLGLAYHGRPTRVLMVGLGGGTFTTLVHRALPHAVVDAVEIDPVVVEAARDWFDVRDGPRYRVHVADAFQWIKSDRGTYDVALLDAYAGEGFDWLMMSEIFFRDVASHMAPGGVVVINVADSDTDDGLSAASAFAKILPPFECRMTPVDGNLLLYAALPPGPADAATRDRWLADWDARGPTDFSLAALAAERGGVVDCNRATGKPPD